MRPSSNSVDAAAGTRDLEADN
ncbi:zinc finger, FYVE domain containing 1 (predicted), isoform CRA_b [Rattus norvegicus]|uniref:Zinc finger, FYVE domain containing 1 (Predicted), isoform CRA_b n=1 Tax=Rattus norvegicus TaxID=10116 RepID=A6JDQ2_RAT|nr:zinc finger, FYVE domain containing 1 (predicted), isoform CRA_b [Rattus norvegicus]EDL81447.1 zinc finger, FYVE domain containing 1 (predicted), isoform CRA_b [Rattus norvegicus]